MHKVYSFTFIVISAIIFLGCEAESSESNAETTRFIQISGKQLKIINNSDFQMQGEVYCYGAEDNIAVSPQILIMGKATIPSNTNVTYKNFVQSSNPAFRINPWFVSHNANDPVAFSATQTNESFGQVYTVGGSSKFANWRYLKVELTTTMIPGLDEPISMVMELPGYSQNNSEVKVIDLTPYGLQKNLHIAQSSFVGSNGDIHLLVDSEVIDIAPISE